MLLWSSFVEILRVALFAFAHVCGGSLGGGIVVLSLMIRIAAGAQCGSSAKGRQCRPPGCRRRHARTQTARRAESPQTRTTAAFRGSEKDASSYGSRAIR